MKILELKTFRGPNYWSDRHKQLVELHLDIRPDIKLTPEIITLTCKSLKTLFPKLSGSGTFSNLEMRGISIFEMIGIVAKEMQLSAGMNSEYLKIVTKEQTNECHILFTYAVEKAGEYAGEYAFRIINSLINGRIYDELEIDIRELTRLKHRYSTGPTTSYILEEFKRRDIPFRRFNEGSLITLGYGIHQKKIRTAITDTTSGLGMELASDKDETKRLLMDAHVPVPNGILVGSEHELRERLSEIKFPVVVKPLNGNHGRGVTTDINTLEDAVFGYNIARRVSPVVIVEEFIKGEDYRFLVINYKLIAVTKRSPAFIIGDGVSTVKDLIEKENSNPQRGEGPEYVLALIRVDKITEKILADKKLTLGSILPQGEKLVLKETANISVGGTAEDVTDSIHPENKFFAERIARLFNLDICGIDVMTTGIDQPITSETGAVIEVNAGPGLRMHSNPQKGKSRDVAGAIVDMLFPTRDAALIPVIAVAESKGANIIVRLINHVATQAGLLSGCNSSDGIYIQGHLTYENNCTGYESEQDILFEPTINFAVVECSDESINLYGLGFLKCDIGIISESPGSDFAANGISSIEESMELKSVIVRNTNEKGFVILNADDEKVLKTKRYAKSNLALFSTKRTETLKKHIDQGGVAAFAENEMLIVCQAKKEIPIAELNSISIFSEFPVKKNLKYILPAVLAAFLQGFDADVIKKSVQSFALPKVEA